MAEQQSHHTFEIRKYITRHIGFRVYSFFLYFPLAHITNTYNVRFIQIVSNAILLDDEIPSEHAGFRVYLFFLYFPFAHITNTYRLRLIRIVTHAIKLDGTMPTEHAGVRV